MGDYSFREYVNAVSTLYVRIRRVSSWAVLMVHPGPDRACYEAPQPPTGVPGTDAVGAVRVMKECLRLWWGTNATLMVKLRGGRMVPLIRILRLTRERRSEKPPDCPSDGRSELQEAIMRAVTDAGKPIKLAGIARKMQRECTNHFRQAVYDLAADGRLTADAAHFYIVTVVTTLPKV